MNKKANSGYGARWFFAILIYYVLFLFVLVAVAPLQGIAYNQEPIKEYCDVPRSIYEPYSNNIELETRLWKTDHLSCDKTIGVTSENICNNIVGCNWEKPPLSFWERFFNEASFGLISYADAPNTCVGDINALNYDIETYESSFLGTTSVAKHENTKSISSFVGSICDHPNIIYNQDLCNLFSCTWNDYDNILNTQLSSIEIEPTNILSLRNIWSTTRDLFTLQYDFGFEGYANFFVTLFFFIIPIIALMLSFYIMVRG